MMDIKRLLSDERVGLSYDCIIDTFCRAEFIVVLTVFSVLCKYLEN